MLAGRSMAIEMRPRKDIIVTHGCVGECANRRQGRTSAAQNVQPKRASPRNLDNDGILGATAYQVDTGDTAR